MSSSAARPRGKRLSAFQECVKCTEAVLQVQGNWKQFKGKAKQRRGKLTVDQLDVINGKREELEGRLQESRC